MCEPWKKSQRQMWQTFGGDRDEVHQPFVDFASANFVGSAVVVGKVFAGHDASEKKVRHGSASHHRHPSGFCAGWSPSRSSPQESLHDFRL